METQNTDFAAVVRAEIKQVEETLKSHVSGQVAEQFRTVQADMAAIREDLKTRALAGESPKAESVKELETRLAAAETSVREMVEAAKTATTKVTSMNEEERDAKLFTGAFIANQEELRSRLYQLRQFGSDSTRAIDASLFATGGKLSPETADRFIDWVIQKQAALSRITTRRMLAPQGHIDELTVSRRSMRKAVDGEAPTVADAIGTKRRTLTTVEVIWAEDITLTFLEDNIERRGAEAHIARLIATQFGNDANDLGWNGDDSEDSSGGDPFRSINQGWIRLAQDDNQVNDVDASDNSGDDATCSGVLGEAMRSLPVEYLGLGDLGYFMPLPFCQRYAEELSQRKTPLGDQVMVNGFPVLRYFGLPVIPEVHLYEFTQDKGMLTPLSNLVFGVQRVVTVDAEWRPRKRAVEYTVTARIDYEYSTGKAIALVSGIPAFLR
jgi:hypothetical protein